MSEEVEIMIRPSGPYVVRGPVRLRDVNGTEFDARRQKRRTEPSHCAAAALRRPNRSAMGRTARSASWPQPRRSRSWNSLRFAERSFRLPRRSPGADALRPDRTQARIAMRSPSSRNAAPAAVGELQGLRAAPRQFDHAAVARRLGCPKSCPTRTGRRPESWPRSRSSGSSCCAMLQYNRARVAARDALRRRARRAAWHPTRVRLRASMS